MHLAARYISLLHLFLHHLAVMKLIKSSRDERYSILIVSNNEADGDSAKRYCEKVLFDRKKLGIQNKLRLKDLCQETEKRG